MNEALLNNRYRLDAELGHGGMGVVYRGHDVLLGRDVAVKLLSKGGLGTEGRARLLREAQAVARLNHPNIVTVYDAGEAEGPAGSSGTFIVMELLSGLSLFERKPATIDELVDVARQVCAALGHAHEHGIIHRDLKPENVVLCGATASGAPIKSDFRVKLTDFGLARSVTSRQTTETGLTGTVFYMPPEQAMGRELDGRADLYSLGVMLYELAAGRLPFAGDDPLTVLAQHLHAPPVPPTTYNSDIPAPLEALILRLLGKQPEERPASAEEVGHALERIARKSTELILAAASAPEASPLERLVRGRLVGRMAELAEARAVWEAATTEGPEPARDELAAPQPPHALLIAGESGVGKTPFVRALRALAEVSRGRWLHGECYAEGGSPYAPFDQAFGALAAEPGLRDALSPSVAADLALIAPSLRGALPAPVAERSGDRSRVFESVVAACAALIATGRGRNPPPAPLMIVIEDVQWADAATLALLRHLARRSRSSGLKLLVAVTFRESEVDASPGLRELVLDFTRERLAARITLDAFDRDQTAELLEVMFQQPPPPAFTGEIFRETDGNLFYIEEVCKALIEEGALKRSGSRWEFPEEFRGEAPPQSVRMMVQARIARLAPETQDAIRLAAVIGREFDFETLRRAAEQSEDTLVDALEEAQNSQLIVEVRDARRGQDEIFRFAHNLIAATLRESVSGLRRRRMHRRVGEVIEALRPDDNATLGYHFLQAGDNGRARTHLAAAGEAARRAYAGSAALKFFSEALELTPDASRERFDLLLARAATCHVLAQRSRQKADIEELLVLAEQLGDEERRFEALLAQAECDVGTQHMAAREPALKAVEIARRLGDGAREGRALVCLGLDARLHGDLNRSRGALELAAERLQDAGQKLAAAGCLQTLSLTLGDLDEFEAAQTAAVESIRLAREVGDRRLEGTALRRLAITYSDQQQFAEALPHAEEALRLHRLVGDPVEQCHSHNVLGIICAYLGRGAEAEAHWRAALPLADAAESVVGGMYALFNMVVLHFAWRGEYLAAIALLREMLRKPYLGENTQARCQLNIRVAESLIAVGLRSEALTVLEEIMPALGELVAQRIITRSARGSVIATHGYALALEGRYDEATARLAEALDEIRDDARQYQQANALLYWTDGALALAAGRGGAEHQRRLRQAIELTEAALDQFCRAAPWNYDSGRAHRLLAELRLAFGENEAALAHAQKAIELRGLRQYSVEEFHHTLARALRANGRDREAADVIRAAYQRVLLVAGRTPDPEAQAAWLERVPVNRAIIAWWEALNEPESLPASTPA
jgi:eukaryotic-like serine/threonine-protein kinase